MAEVFEERVLRNRIHIFDDRFHAGKLLAEKLIEYQSREKTCVLAIPAGGVQVAYEIAERLELPLDVVITRKLHIPWNREAGFGAVSWDGQIRINKPLAAALGLTREDIERSVAQEKEVIKRRLEMYRGKRPFPDLRGKTVIIVDDGLASGFSMLTTLEVLEQRGVEETVVAVPTAPESAIDLIKMSADKIFCLNVRSGPFFAVADAYKVWYDLNNGEVVNILKKIEDIHEDLLKRGG
jgi:predicted phosphoribosyltransferase